MHLHMHMNHFHQRLFSIHHQTCFKMLKFSLNVVALLAWVAFAPLALAQNPCGVQGTVVSASGLSYTPQDLNIEAGETVVWVNYAGTHNVNGMSSTTGAAWNNPESFMLPTVTGTSAGVCIGSYTFTEPGTYQYDCSIGSHAASGMVGTVTVTAPPPASTVVDIIVNSPDHTTLETAVLAAGLAGTLSGDGPFTVFAPTDAAFAALPAGTLDAVLADIDLLTAILTYHVVGAAALSTDLSNGQVIETLNGESVTVTIDANGVFINDAEVIVADLVADNGVVHVIDAVLLPPTNVAEAAASSWSVFPNPAQDIIRIEGWENAARDVLVINALGATVAQWAPTQQAFSVESFDAGIYFIGSPDTGWKRLVIR